MIKLRLYIIIAGFIVSFLFIIYKVFYITTFSENTIYKRENKLLLSFKKPRGNIYDRNLRAIAISIEGYSVFANPKRIKKVEIYMDKLSKLLNVSPLYIREKLSSNKPFVWLKRNLPKKVASKIVDLKLPYIGIEKNYTRRYPDKNLFSHILGFVGAYNKGLEGIEYSLNEFLSQGKDIILTVDSNIQYTLREELLKAYQKYNPKCAYGIVTNTKTGEILGMVSLPDFDPNEYYRYPKGSYKNCNISNLIEPGSVMKMFVLAAALQEKIITLNDIFLCKGRIKIKDGEYVRCTGVHGLIDVYDAMKKSCNVTFIKIALKIGKKRLYEYLKKFGFTKKTALLLPGEVKGILRPLNRWSYRSIFAIPIGQEIATTGAKLLENALVFPNLGYSKRLKIVSFIGTKMIEDDIPSSRIISKRVAKEVLETLEGVVSPGGTGERAIIKGFKIAAKTGTSQKWIPGEGYKKHTAIFIGFFPAENPLIGMIIVVDEPESGGYAGEISAPVFKEVAKKIIEYLGIGKKNIKLKSLEKEKPIISMGKIIKNPKKLPDFKGLTIREALKIIKILKIKNYSIYGTGICSSQKPKAGEDISKIKNLKLYFKPIASNQ